MVKRLFVIALLAATCCSLPLLASPPESPKTKLEAGRPLSGELAPGQTLAFEAALQKGQYVKVVALQDGIDFVLTVFDPKGIKIQEVDSPNGAFGPEPYASEVKESGSYRFEIQALEPKAKPGKYRMEIALLLSPEQYAAHRIVDLDPATYPGLQATFEVEPGRYILVGRTSALYIGAKEDALAYQDTKTLRTGVLFPTSPTDFFSGPDLTEPYPPEDEFHFVLDEKGTAKGLTWTPKGGKPVQAKKVFPFTLEKISFQSGNVTLKGWLHIPEGKGPFPAFVYAHGSQGSPSGVGPTGNFFVMQGCAFLAFDKRGGGESSGNWQTASFDDLVGDILAGFAFLKGRKEIDPTRLGIWGASQGGWIGSMTAAKSPDVKYLLVQSGSGVSVADNMVHETASQMPGAGLSAQEIAEAKALLRKLLQMMADGEPYEKVVEAAQAAKDKPYQPFMYPGDLPKDHYLWTWMRLNGNYDSTAYLKKVTCPVLWFLGDKDSQVPVAASEPRLRQAAKEAGNKDFTLKILPDANHGLLESKTVSWSEVHSSKRYVSGYWDAMAAWIGTHVTTKK